MALLDDSKLEKLATNVVENFLMQNTPLTDSVIKHAEEENFNPEQIKRLVEAVNNMAFLRKFEGAEDRMAASEFQPADANAAMHRMLDTAKELMASLPSGTSDVSNDTATTLKDLVSDLPNTRPEEQCDDLSGTASKTLDIDEPSVKGTIMILKLRKTAELLRDQEYEAQIRFTETFQKLATQFTRLNATPFTTFEKDAFYQWGSQAAPFLNMFRGSLRLPEADYDHTAFTKTARIVDTRTPLMRDFQTLMHYSDAVRKATKSREKVAAYLKQLE